MLIPIERGYYKYESLKDGTLDLADIALIHDFLMVMADNKTLFAKE